jgi:hypothetical protein
MRLEVVCGQCQGTIPLAGWGGCPTLHCMIRPAMFRYFKTRRDHAAENLAIIRKIALNILKTARPDISIRRKRKRSGWSEAFARTIIGQMR